jgi:excisionase family DNA binding protein
LQQGLQQAATRQRNCNKKRMKPMSDTTAPDLLYGAKAIAQYLGVTDRQAEHMIETKRIPYGKIGRRVVSSRSRLDAYQARLIDEPMAA